MKSRSPLAVYRTECRATLRPRSSFWTLAWTAVLLAGLLAIQATPATAELEVVAQRGGEFRNALVAGDYAYVGQGGTLVTIPLAGSGKGGAGAEAEVRVSAPLPGVVNDLAIHGDTLYVSWESLLTDVRLTRFSLADPSQPALIGPFEVPGGGDLRATGLEVVGDVLYVVDGEDLVSFDLSGPVPVAGTTVDGGSLDQLRPGGLDQLLACGISPIGSSTCRIYDVSTPLAPAVEGFFYSSSNPSG